MQCVSNMTCDGKRFLQKMECLCRFLKPGGAMYPSHARLYLGVMRSNHTHQRVHEFQVGIQGVVLKLVLALSTPAL